MIRLAEKQAKKSTFMRHRLGAVITKGNRVLSTGYNEIRYSKVLGKPTVHAEEAAVLKLLKRGHQTDLVGSSIYVTRFTKGGNIGCAMPCVRCRSLLRSVGVVRAFYSDDGGDTKELML
jgi:deoxycytidylate deaminase